MAVQERKTKIVLDADVIIHFAKGGRLNLLPRILPEYQFLVLDVVKKELPLLIMSVLQKIISQDRTILEEVFGQSTGEMKEYARLISRMAWPSVVEKVPAWCTACIITMWWEAVTPRM